MTDNKDLIERLRKHVKDTRPQSMRTWDMMLEAADALEAQQWQPIETAPDLEDLLVKSPDHKPVIAWHGDGSQKRPYEWRLQYSDHKLHFKPTQWKYIDEAATPPIEEPHES